jgi:hypothetical protein
MHGMCDTIETSTGSLHSTAYHTAISRLHDLIWFFTYFNDLLLVSFIRFGITSVPDAPLKMFRKSHRYAKFTFFFIKASYKTFRYVTLTEPLHRQRYVEFVWHWVLTRNWFGSWDLKICYKHTSALKFLSAANW